MMALIAAIDPLRHANKLLGKPRFQWAVYSGNGQPVISSSGLELNPNGSREDIDLTSKIILCGGLNIAACNTDPLLHWLRRAARCSPLIGGLCTAPWLLAEAGLLDGYRATIHWEMGTSFREAFPRVEVCDSLYELDRTRMTCAGEGASVDMMVALLATHHGDNLAAGVAAQILHSRIRSSRESQSPLHIRYATRNPRLLEAIELMEANIEEPLEIGSLVKHLGGSRRQFERLFDRQLNISPVAFYRNLRLDRARQLVTSTHLSCIEIGMACGFRTPASFSKAYERRFGISPYKDKGIPPTNRRIDIGPEATSSIKVMGN